MALLNHTPTAEWGTWTCADIDKCAKREINLLKTVSPHPNIVHFVEAFEEARSAFLVMEHLTCDLTAFVDTWYGGCGLPVMMTKHVIFQICAALKHVHDTGYVFRDTKPANVLTKLSERGAVRDGARLNEGALLAGKAVIAKLCDFGCARKLGPNTSKDDMAPSWPTPADVLTTRVGTLVYCPPETLLGTPFWDDAAGVTVHSAYGVGFDMWGLGVTMVECLTGEMLFAVGDAKGQLMKIQAVLGSLTSHQHDLYTRSHRQDLPRPAHRPHGISSTIGPGLLDAAELRFLTSLLKVDPAQRPTAAAALADPCFQNLFHAP